MSVIDLKLKQEALIKSLNIKDISILNRLYDLGLQVGSKVKLCNVAPLGDPYKLKINDFCVAIKKDIAKNIIIELI